MTLPDTTKAAIEQALTVLKGTADYSVIYTGHNRTEEAAAAAELCLNCRNTLM